MVYWKTLAAFALVLLAATALGEPTRVLHVRVKGEAVNETMYLQLVIDGKWKWFKCQLEWGECSVEVNGTPRVDSVIFRRNLLVVEARGALRKNWIGSWRARPDRFITYYWSPPGWFRSRVSLDPSESPEGLSLEVSVRKGCLIMVSIDQLENFPLLVHRWGSPAPFEVNGSKFIPVPTPLDARREILVLLDTSSELGQLLNRFYSRVAGYSRRVWWRGKRWAALEVGIDCSQGNVSLAYLIVKNVRTELEQYLEKERSLLAKTGFDPSEVLADVELALQLIRESERELAAGRTASGLELLKKGLEKSLSALESVSQMKTDSVPAFMYLMVFTFFLSSIIGQLVEKRRGLVMLVVFLTLVALELALIPYARMALLFLNPDIVRLASPSTMLLSIIVAVTSLTLIAVLILSAKGTALSDFFWYSVRSMKSRKLRAMLTIFTIAVVTAAAGAFLAVGSATIVDERSYESTFRGLSVSRHVTVAQYIMRGIDQPNEVVVREGYLPLSEGELRWLAGAEWVEKVYVVLVGSSKVGSGGVRVPAVIVATNATETGSVAISRKLASRLQVRVGDTIVVGGVNVTVKGIFDGVPEMIDGAPFDELLVRVFVNGVEESPPKPPAHLVLGGLDVAPPEAEVYRVILEGSPPPGIGDRLVRLSYVWSSNFTVIEGAQVSNYTYESYRVCVGGEGETRCTVIVGEFHQLAGVPEFMVVLAISSMTVAVSLLGSMHERRSEYSTISALGASPGLVAAVVLVEGLSYGVLGGVAGYLLGQFIETLHPVKAIQVKGYVFSPILTTLVVAIVPSLFGSLIPAREAALRVVPSRLMIRKTAEVQVFEDMAEASVPLRVLGDEELFAEYVRSLLNRPPGIGWGPIYKSITIRRRDGRIDYIEAEVSFRSERAAIYLLRIYLPRGTAETIKLVASSPTGEWTVDHKACARDFLTAVRDDLLRYVEWKKERQIRKV